MNEKTMLGILKRILSKDEIQNLTQSLIITTKTGYEMFGEYSITQVKGKYVVNKHTTYLNESFFGLRNAVVWATLDKRNLVADANRVKELDILLEGATASLDLYKILSERAKTLDSKSIHVNKLQEAFLKKQSVQEEISSFIRETTRWQNQKFKQATK